jgi:glutaredoxin
MYKVYGTKTCAFCTRAKNLLNEKGLPFEFVVVGEEISIADFKEKIMGIDVEARITVPQVFNDNKLVGGYEELRASI